MELEFGGFERVGDFLVLLGMELCVLCLVGVVVSMLMEMHCLSVLAAEMFAS